MLCVLLLKIFQCTTRKPKSCFNVRLEQCYSMLVPSTVKEHFCISLHSSAPNVKAIVSSDKNGVNKAAVSANNAIYAITFVTTPAPTVFPPSRNAKRKPSAIATGEIS